MDYFVLFGFELHWTVSQIKHVPWMHEIFFVVVYPNHTTIVFARTKSLTISAKRENSIVKASYKFLFSFSR